MPTVEDGLFDEKGQVDQMMQDRMAEYRQAHSAQSGIKFYKGMIGYQTPIFDGQAVAGIGANKLNADFQTASGDHVTVDAAMPGKFGVNYVHPIK